MGYCFLLRRGGVPSPSGLPQFTYSGDCLLFDEGGGNWCLQLLSSGTLCFRAFGTGGGTVDVFAVGGGGGGCTVFHPVNGCHGGGGGYTATRRLQVLLPDTPYEAEIGQGGTSGGRGGTTRFCHLTAAGGEGGTTNRGGNGGSGGGAYRYGGGSDGGNGLGSAERCGFGQGSTTRAFGMPQGECYGGGGAGGSHTDSVLLPGGAGGGGRGAYTLGGNGAPNTGGGGGGRGGGGGSGTVLIRNGRRDDHAGN